MTEGLNTQIAISETDILATQKVVEKINKKLKAVHVKIVRQGEYEDKYNISVLDFAKMYRMIKLEPGTSKNLNRKLVEKTLKEAEKDTNLGDYIRLVIDANYWWINRKDEKNNDVNENILKYGKNYFCSYVISRKIRDYDEVTFSQLYFDYLGAFKKIEGHLDQNDFKRDDLFHEIINHNKESIISSYSIQDDEKELLIEYLNGDENDTSNINVRLAAYYQKVHNEKLEFRTVVRTKVKNSNGEYMYRAKETYPFSNKSFLELSEVVKDGARLMSFDESQFKKELEKKINIFVVDKDNDKYVDINYLKNVSFAKYENDAKKVFELAESAFEEGDENLLPKSGDGISFHIRPKAINSDDTFEFSNGKLITKRAFYANRETVDRLIEDSLMYS